MPRDLLIHSPRIGDPKVATMERLLSSGFNFANVSWDNGDASLPLLPVPKKKIRHTSFTHCPSSAQSITQTPSSSPRPIPHTVSSQSPRKNKTSIIDEVRHYQAFDHSDPNCPSRKRCNSAQPVSTPRSTRSYCAAIHVPSCSERSTTHLDPLASKKHRSRSSQEQPSPPTNTKAQSRSTVSVVRLSHYHMAYLLLHS